MKLIENTPEVRAKLLTALDKIAKPVVQTLSPKGGNVMYEDSNGGIYVTNDGVTIAKQIGSEDTTEDAIIRAVKYAALQTNKIAGDGTTTTILLTDTLVREGKKLLDAGMNEMDLKDMLTGFNQRILGNLKPILVKNQSQLLSVAKISSNGDDEIARNVLQVVKVAGDSGMVFINPSHTEKTEVVEDTGFVINGGFLSPELANDGAYRAQYEDVHVLVTDKRLYYEEECAAILTAALDAGITKLVIVARDFIGKAPNLLISNHTHGTISLLLVKHPDASETNNAPLSDLAKYLGGNLVTEKTGKVVNKLSKEDFIVAKKVYSTPDRTVLVTVNPVNPQLTDLIKSVEKEKEKYPDDKTLEARLATLTTGTVTVNVGGATPLEVQERIFRYEDAINATRAAKKHGYLVGGGVALRNATLDEKEAIFIKYGDSSLRQIAENCGQHPQFIIQNVKGNVGYNAKTNTFEDLIEAGVIDPYKVTEMAINNSISVAIALLTSRYIITNKKDDNGNERSKERVRGD